METISSPVYEILSNVVYGYVDVSRLLVWLGCIFHDAVGELDALDDFWDELVAV